MRYFTKELGPIGIWGGTNVKMFCPVFFGISINDLADKWYGLDIQTDPFTLILSLGPRYYGIGLNMDRPWAKPKKELED